MKKSTEVEFRIPVPFGLVGYRLCVDSAAPVWIPQHLIRLVRLNGVVMVMAATPPQPPPQHLNHQLRNRSLLHVLDNTMARAKLTEDERRERRNAQRKEQRLRAKLQKEEFCGYDTNGERLIDGRTRLKMKESQEAHWEYRQRLKAKQLAKIRESELQGNVPDFVAEGAPNGNSGGDEGWEDVDVPTMVHSGFGVGLGLVDHARNAIWETANLQARRRTGQNARNRVETSRLMTEVIPKLGKAYAEFRMPEGCYCKASEIKKAKLLCVDILSLYLHNNLLVCLC